MPDSFAALDNAYPRLTNNVRKDVTALADYIYQLLEQLRYTLYNLDLDNLTDATIKTLSNDEVLTALSEAGAAVINAANITGTMSGVAVKGMPDGTLPSDAATVHNVTKHPVIIPTGQLDASSTSTVLVATVPNVTELKDGVEVYIMNGVVTSAANCTLNVNGLGAKPIYSSLAAASRVSTLWNINYTFQFVYNETRVEGGCWDLYYGYNSDTNTIAYNVRRGQADSVIYGTKLYRYEILFSRYDGKLIPVNGVSNKPTTYTKALTTESWDPFGPILYYSTTAAVEIGDAPSASYLYERHSSVDLRYGFNTGTTLTANAPVYLQLSPQTDGSVKLSGDNPIVQTLPNAADNYVYMRLGRAYSTSQIELDLRHPIYKYDNGKLILWTGG